MVPNLCGIIEHTALRFANNAFQIRVFKLGALDLVIQVGDLGLMVFAVMEIDGFARNGGFQGGAVIGQGG